VSGASVSAGEGRTWRVDHPATFNIDVKGAVRNANHDGSHACLKETLWQQVTPDPPRDRLVRAPETRPSSSLTTAAMRGWLPWRRSRARAQR